MLRTGKVRRRVCIIANKQTKNAKTAHKHEEGEEEDRKVGSTTLREREREREREK